MSPKQCYYCGKTFSTGYNLRRHVDNHICKMDDIEGNESTYDEETSSEEVEEDSEVGTSESESHDAEEEEEEEEEPEVDCWSVLIKETMDRYEIELENLENQYMEKGESKASSEVLAYNKMIPAFQNELRNVLLEKLVWIRALRRDPYYRKIMRTRRDLLDTGDYDWIEATQVAIDQRKFLLNNLFTTQHFQIQTEEAKDME